MLNQLFVGDILNNLSLLPSECVDLVFADPPYNLQLQRDLWRPNQTRVDAVDDEWDQFEDFAAYDQFTRDWLIAVRRVMKDTATIWISGTYHNIFRVGAVMQDLGFWVLNMVTWHKPNAMPNFRGIRLKNDGEFVIWAKKHANSRYTFNHHAMKELNGGKQMGSLWTIPLCTGAERLRDGEGKKLHPTQKPEALLERIIRASTNAGDVVLDPFMGSGTTGAVAKRMRRAWIGIERDPIYAAAAQTRIDEIVPLDHADPNVGKREKMPRISMRKLVENDYISAGETLQLDTPQVTVTVLANGKIQMAEGRVSTIHRLGAILKDAPSCNGWMHWHRYNALTDTWELIDLARQRYRADNPIPEPQT